MNTATLVENPFENRHERMGFGRPQSGGLRIEQTQGLGRNRYRPIFQMQDEQTAYRRALFTSRQGMPRVTEVRFRSGLVAELLFLYNSEHFGLSEKFCHRLVELLELRAGWDGENAKAPRPEVLARMTGFVLSLKNREKLFIEPFLTPTVEGYAQLEWHDSQRDLDIEAESSGWSIVGSENNSQMSRIYYEADANVFEIYKLVEAYRWFIRRKSTWPMI